MTENYDYDALGKKDLGELSREEAAALAQYRATASHRDLEEGGEGESLVKPPVVTDSPSVEYAEKLTENLEDDDPNNIRADATPKADEKSAEASTSTTSAKK